MNCVNHLVTESLPGYLKGLPIPNTVCSPQDINVQLSCCWSGAWLVLTVGGWLGQVDSLWSGCGGTFLLVSAGNTKSSITSTREVWQKSLKERICLLDDAILLRRWWFCDWNPQGLAHSPVVGPFLREKLTMLPGMQVFLKNMWKVKTWNVCRTQGWTPVSKWTVQRFYCCSLTNNDSSHFFYYPGCGHPWYGRSWR